MSILNEIENINKVKSALLVRQRVLLQGKRDIIANYLEGKMADFKDIKPIYIKRERIYPHKETYFEEQYFTRVKCKDNTLYFFSNKNTDFNGYFANHMWVSEKKFLEFPNNEDLLENLLDNIDLQTAREAFFSSLPNTI